MLKSKQHLQHPCKKMQVTVNRAMHARRAQSAVSAGTHDSIESFTLQIHSRIMLEAYCRS